MLDTRNEMKWVAQHTNIPKIIKDNSFKFILFAKVAHESTCYLELWTKIGYLQYSSAFFSSFKK